MKLHDPKVNVTDPAEALQFLKEGNARFVSGNLMPRTSNAEDRIATKDSQHPFAAILTCADSRVCPELLFDQKIGDIFVCTNAGNVADKSVVGSFEFAVAALKVPLVVVLGHTMCGAVHNAHGGTSGLPAHLQNVLNDIREGVHHSTDKESAALDNTQVQANKLKNNDVINSAMVVTAHYDIATGEVVFD
jgi:carbonic anhydrase